MLITVKKGFKVPCAVRALTLTTDKPGMPERIPRCPGFHHHQTPSSSTMLQLCHMLWGLVSEFILYPFYTQPTSAAQRHLGPPEASSAHARGGPSGKPDRLVMSRRFLGGLSPFLSPSCKKLAEDIESPDPPPSSGLCCHSNPAAVPISLRPRTWTLSVSVAFRTLSFPLFSLPFDSFSSLIKCLFPQE